jgi:hypothetical protein
MEGADERHWRLQIADASGIQGFRRAAQVREEIGGIVQGYSPMAGTRRGGRNRPTVELGRLGLILKGRRHSDVQAATGNGGRGAARPRGAQGGVALLRGDSPPANRSRGRRRSAQAAAHTGVVRRDGGGNFIGVRGSPWHDAHT